MHALHMGWGIGFFISPFIVLPFLGSTKPDLTGNLTAAIGNGTTPTGCYDDSRIHMPFIIAGTIGYAMGVLALMLFLRGPPKDMTYFCKPKQSYMDVISPASCGNGDSNFAVLFLSLFALFYFGNAGREWTCNIWLFTYAVESDLGFTKVEAALFDASAKGSFVLGRLLIVPISHFLPIQPLLFTEVYSVLCLITCIVTF